MLSSSPSEADIVSDLILLPSRTTAPRPVKHSFKLQLLSMTVPSLMTQFCIVQLYFFHVVNTSKIQHRLAEKCYYLSPISTRPIMIQLLIFDLAPILQSFPMEEFLIVIFSPNSHPSPITLCSFLSSFCGCVSGTQASGYCVTTSGGIRGTSLINISMRNIVLRIVYQAQHLFMPI